MFSTGLLSTMNVKPFIFAWGGDFLDLPLISDGRYNFDVDWGDGTSDRITSWNQPEKTHTYTTSGFKQVVIKGIIEGWSFGQLPSYYDYFYLIRWGCLRFTKNNTGHFQDTWNGFFENVQDLPLFGTDRTLKDMFKNAGFVGINRENEWDLSGVINTNSMFYSELNGVYGPFFMRNYFTVPDWDTHNVTDMSYMFYNAYAYPFNFGPICQNWDVSKVTNMSYMFASGRDYFIETLKINPDVENWNVSNVELMEGMFDLNEVFNKDISNWNIAKVTNMTNFITNTNFNYQYYDNMLIKWAALPVLQNNVPLDMVGVKRSHASDAAKNYLVNTKGWIITDGGLI